MPESRSKRQRADQALSRQRHAYTGAAYACIHVNMHMHAVRTYESTASPREFSSPLAVVQVREVTLLQPHVGVILQAGGEVGGNIREGKGTEGQGEIG